MRARQVARGRKIDFSQGRVLRLEIEFDKKAVSLEDHSERFSEIFGRI
jgi:hypothetical protein